jgi:hypothetical protein
MAPPSLREDATIKLKPHLRIVYVIACGTLIALPFMLGLVPAVKFERERIDIDAYPDAVTIDGKYVYRNPWPICVVQALVVPVPTDALHAVPSKIEVTDHNEDLPSFASGSEKAVLVAFSPFQRKVVRVRYRQVRGTENATYILKTTKPWRRPLDFAEYTLTEHGTELVASNYALARQSQTYFWERSRFMPDEDWHFAWRKLLVAGGSTRLRQ